MSLGCFTRPQGLSDTGGIAVVMVLWVLVLLSVIAGSFCYAMRTELRIVKNSKELSESYYIALAGINAAIEGLVDQKFSAWRYKTDNFLHEAERGRQLPLRVNIENPVTSFGGGTYSLWIDNESGKINLNGAGPNLLRLLFGMFGLSDGELDIIVDSILDWRDTDHLHRLNGAENDYYKALPEPYACKNGPFDSVDELRFVRGVSGEMVSERFKQLVTVFLPPLPFDEAELKKQTREAYLLREKRKNYAGPDLSRVNINAAKADLLSLVPGMKDEGIRAIFEFRKDQEIRSLSQIRPLVGDEVYNRLATVFHTSETPYYMVYATGRSGSGRITRTLSALVEINTKLKNRYQILSLRNI